MFYVYILYSKSKDQYYIGQANNVEKRIVRHNKGEVRSTKHGLPWEMKYPSLPLSLPKQYQTSSLLLSNV